MHIDNNLVFDQGRISDIFFFESCKELENEFIVSQSKILIYVSWKLPRRFDKINKSEIKK